MMHPAARYDAYGTFPRFFVLSKFNTDAFGDLASLFLGSLLPSQLIAMDLVGSPDILPGLKECEVV